MRKLIIILFSLCVVLQALSQTPAYQTYQLGPFPAYKGQYEGWKWPLVVTEPPEIKTYIATNKTSEKPLCACSLDGAGIGERSTNYPNMATYGTGDAYELFQYGQPPNWQFTTSPYYGVKYSSPGRSENKCWLYASFQVWQGDGYTRQTYWYNSLRWLIDKYGPNGLNVLDTNRIYITGLSLGAGGVAGALQDENILNMIAGSYSLMTGYYNVPNFSPSFNWQALRNTKWRGIIVIEHALDDNIVTYMMSRNMADSIAKYKLPITLVYRERVNGAHTLVVNDAWDPGRANVNITLSNGNTYNHAVRWQSMLLMRTKSGRRKD
jgi:hypothetical protein